MIGSKLARRRLYNKSVEVARVAREVEVVRERQRQGAERGKAPPVLLNFVPKHCNLIVGGKDLGLDPRANLGLRW